MESKEKKGPKPLKGLHIGILVILFRTISLSFYSIINSRMKTSLFFLKNLAIWTNSASTPTTVHSWVAKEVENYWK